MIWRAREGREGEGVECVLSAKKAMGRRRRRERGPETREEMWEGEGWAREGMGGTCGGFEVASSCLQELQDLLPGWLQRVCRGTSESVTIVIDGMDQLSDEAARTLRWLPSRIPHNCKLILTTLDDELRSCKLRGWTNIVQLPPVRASRSAPFAPFPAFTSPPLPSPLLPVCALPCSEIPSTPFPPLPSLPLRFRSHPSNPCLSACVDHQILLFTIPHPQSFLPSPPPSHPHLTAQGCVQSGLRADLHEASRQEHRLICREHHAARPLHLQPPLPSPLSR